MTIVAPVQPEPSVNPHPRLWTRAEYYRAAEVGLFGADERLELIEGEVLAKVSPQRAPHSTSVRAATEALTNAFGHGFEVRAQLPLTLSDRSEPEPDVLVASGSWRTYEDHHPGAAEALLLVEVSDSTLAYDRIRKASLYADAGVREYWIINLVERTLEIRRNPSPGLGYGDVAVLTEDAVCSPLAAPNASILVSDLLPSPS